MTKEELMKVKSAPRMLRGEVHRYHTESGYSALCVIISANHRAKDKYISIISLKDVDDQKHLMGDEVALAMPDGREYFCHCGMITYMRRDRIDELVTRLSREQMYEIDTAIMDEIGIKEVLE